MNKRVIVYVLGAVLLIEAALMLLPLLVAVIYREKNGWYFLRVLLGAAVLGALALGLGGRKRSAMYAKEGLIAVALSWIVLSLVGALPFTLSGQIPFYLDAVFEMISGFTTTGSSILPAVESLDRCMLFWRSLSHWIGGMGILVFMLAIVRMDGGQAIHLLRAESPGPTVSKMVPRMVDSSKILYGIYFGLTVVQILLYLAGGEPLFDSLCNAFGTAGTGGFAIRNDSFASYSAYTQTVTTIFMALFGVNFSIYFFLLRRKFDLAWKNTELRWYVSIIVLSTLLITFNIRPLYHGDFGYSLHHAAFTVSSVITTTGYGTHGTQRRAFHAVLSKDGHIIGFIMASVFNTYIFEQMQTLFPTYLLAAMVMLVVSVLLSHGLVSLLRDSLMGHHPTELLDLYLRQDVVLNALEEGLIATDSNGVIAYATQAARQLFQLPQLAPATEGCHFKDLFPASQADRVLTSGVPSYHRACTNGNHRLLVSEVPVNSQTGSDHHQ